MSIHATVPGTLGKDAELRQTQGGPVCSFSIATEERIKGEKHTIWVRCSLFGKRGESLCQYLTKGSKVTALGRITLHEYQGKTSIELAVNSIELQGGKRSEQTAPATSATTGGGYPESDYGGDAGDDHFGF
jgi:single-strand DNA-binding protein